MYVGKNGHSKLIPAECWRAWLKYDVLPKMEIDKAIGKVSTARWTMRCLNKREVRKNEEVSGIVSSDSGDVGSEGAI